MLTKRVKLTWVASLLLVFILSVSIASYVYSQSTNFTISLGIYPGAPSYTIWKEGSTYYAKNVYGAIDYNGTDASVIIYETLQDLLTTGGKVLLGTGTFNLYFTNHKAIRIGDHTTLQGQGFSTILYVADGAMANLAGYENDAVIQSQYAGPSPAGTSYGIVIRDLTLDCNQAGQTGLGSQDLQGIDLHWASGCVIQNVKVLNAWDFGIRTYPSNPAVKVPAETIIDGCYVEKCGYSGNRSSLVSTTLSAQFTANQTTMFVADGSSFSNGMLIRIGTTGGIDGNYEWRWITSHNATSITINSAIWYTHAIGQTVKNIELTGGIMTSDGSGTAVKVIITNNHVKNCMIGIWVEENNGGSIISNNVVTDNWYVGIDFHTVGGNGTVVSGNFASGNWWAGLQAGLTSGVRVLDINGLVSCGNKIGLVSVMGHELNIHGGIFNYNRECGLWIQAYRNMINGIQALENGQKPSAAKPYGIYITKDTDSHSILNSRIGNDNENIQQYGIYEENTVITNIICNNNFYANVIAAIRLAPNSQSSVMNNRGYNPVGAITNPYLVAAGELNNTGGAQAYPTSGATYTVRNSPKTIIVGGGTISAIAINGVTTGLTSGAFHLSLGETIQVTHSVNPTINQVYAE